MVVNESGGRAFTDHHTAESRSGVRTRKYGTTVGPFQDDIDVDKNADELSLNHGEIGASDVPEESASSSCDPTDSIRSSPTRISFSLSYNVETESLKSGSPEGKESSSLMNDCLIPTIEIVPSLSRASSAADVDLCVHPQNAFDEDRISGGDGPFLNEHEKKFVPPDGGYGWVVVLAACFANVWIVGFVRSYSILYLRIIREYGGSAYQASWIHALLTTTGLLTGPVTGLLCRKYGARKVSFAGGLFAFSGIFLGSFSTSIMHFICTIGLLGGIGVGFVSTSGILFVNLYFDKHRGVASALCMSGNAIGAFLTPPLMEYLLQEYGLRGTLLITSALQLHILVAASLFRPTDVHVLIQELDRKRALRSARNKAQLPRTVDDLKEKKWPKLEILQSAGSQNPSSKVSTVDSKRNKDRDSLTLELSPYRSIPLTASVPNLKEFRESVINMQVWRNEAGNKRNEVENKPSFQHIASAEEFERPTRKRSSSECEFTGRALHVDVRHLRSLDVPLEESPKEGSVHNNSNILQAEGSRERKISLRRHVISNSVPERGNDTAQDMIAAKNPESNDELAGLDTPNASLPLLENSSEGIERSVKYENGSLKKASTPSQQKTSPEDKKSSVRESFKVFAKSLGECFDTSVLKSKSMIIMGFSASLYSMGVPQALFYLHAFYTSVGMYTREVTSLLSITAVCDLCGRLSIGFIADANYFKVSHLMAGCTLLASAGALSVPSTSTLVTAAVAMGCYSFGVGSFIVLLPTILARNLGIDRLPATYGFIRLAMGLTTFIAPQVIGAVVDSTGSYLPTYYLMGSCILLGAVLLVFMPSPPAQLPDASP